MEDSVTLARQEREKQGPWEAEVSYGGEADLHRHLAGCDKNPGHQKFVPVDKFNVNHLPPGCHDNDLVDLIRAMSDLTVRVSVKYVSEGRPETVPGSGKPYPCYKNRGSDMMRVGTGWVWGVTKYVDEEDKYLDEENKYPDKEDKYLDEENKYPDKEDKYLDEEDKYLGEENNYNKNCSCQECLISPTPKTQFAHIHIITAAHVVYDSLEAAHTTCHLFFDKGGMPEACSGVVTLRGGSVVWKCVESDWSQMSFVTHDLDLAARLDKMVNHWQILHERLNEKLVRLETEKHKSSSQKGELLDTWDGLTIIVSHPHGCSKQVSVGYCIYTERDGPFPWTYTTATCPGSSGACVFVLKRGTSFYWRSNRVHSGNCEQDNNLNFCNKLT